VTSSWFFIRQHTSEFTRECPSAD